LTDLRAFWFDALPTAVTLMKQFVTDINAYLEVCFEESLEQF
uniref:Transposase n=1 Tax=Anisakis simplex TaxID=6269 RepID=A0A0M3JFU5_ANISI